MNRIDRISAILVQLQSRPVVRAADMAERFEVSLRTIYRDIHTLSQAGIPIYGDAGIGYSLMEGYQLPPLMFSKEEALAFVTAGKFVEKLTDDQNNSHFVSGMDKIRAVLRRADKSDLANVGDSIEVYRKKTLPNPKLPNLIQVILGSVNCQTALQMRYFTPSRNDHSERVVEAVGVSYIYPFWYLTAYCHLRSEYRHFRLDRVEELMPTTIEFTRQHPPLKELLADLNSHDCLIKVVLQTTPQTSRQMGEQKHFYGLTAEKEIRPDVCEQTYMCYSLETMMRWIVAYFDTIKIIEPQELNEKIVERINQINKKLDYEH